MQIVTINLPFGHQIDNSFEKRKIKWVGCISQSSNFESEEVICVTDFQHYKIKKKSFSHH